MARAPKLYADLGNQRLKLASADQLSFGQFAWRETAEIQRLQQCLLDAGTTEVRLASSSEEGLQVVRETLPADLRLLVLAARQVPLEITTTGTGIDRLLASWFAWRQAGGAVLVADCGTAYTLDLTDAEGRFLGGAIGAGLGLQRQALADACPHLAPPLEQPGEPVPRDTASAVGVGIYDAFAVALQGLAERFAEQLPAAPRKFLTGGDATQLESRLPDWQPLDHLVLRALLALPEDVWR